MEADDRMQARVTSLNEQQAIFGNASILEICLDLRTGVNGSADAWSKEQIASTVEFLQKRLACWTEGRQVAARFDNAVKDLVEATLKEVEYYTWDRQ